MTRFADGTVMEEVLIEFQFFKGTIIVLLPEFVDREAMLSHIGLQNVSKVSWLCLGGKPSGQYQDSPVLGSRW